MRRRCSVIFWLPLMSMTFSCMIRTLSARWISVSFVNFFLKDATLLSKWPRCRLFSGERRSSHYIWHTVEPRYNGSKSNGNPPITYSFPVKRDLRDFFFISYNGNSRNPPIMDEYLWSLEIRYSGMQLYLCKKLIQIIFAHHKQLRKRDSSIYTAPVISENSFISELSKWHNLFDLI